jgi:arsenite/tail-anchored protein-transporting ATPase
VLVLTPERLPIDDTARAAVQLRQTGVLVGAVVVNRVLPLDATGDFLEARRRQQQIYLSSRNRRTVHGNASRAPHRAARRCSWRRGSR